MTFGSARPGYAFLMTVLVVGAIAAGAVATLLLLGTSVLRGTVTLEAAARAQEAASACAEHALRSLRNDLGYAGDETVSLDGGAACDVLPVTGFGNADRSVCVEAEDGSVTRRLEISVSQVLPKTRVLFWRDVSSFSLCGS